MTGDSLSSIEAQFRTDNDMRKTDVAYFHELLHGVPSCVADLDSAISPFLDREITELDQVERAILRLATYELLKRQDIPYRVAINEGIELAKTFGATESHKYVNGVLDKVAQRLRYHEVNAQRLERAAQRQNPPDSD
ncbi:N utilization substance protein B, transcription termination factor [gamma proteobacterium HdN1]|nr:N utilization substance protein B, transcription termination factor [gamma proteobacterium HdN1]